MDEPLSIANFDSRYHIPCGGEHIVFDCAHGLGSFPNNREIRYLGFAVLMSARRFSGLAATLTSPVRESTSYLLAHRVDPGWGPPTLYVNIDRPQVTGHEGRHRAIVFTHVCPGTPLLVHVVPRGEDYEVRARDLTRDQLERVREGLYDQDSHSNHYWERYAADPRIAIEKLQRRLGNVDVDELEEVLRTGWRRLEPLEKRLVEATMSLRALEFRLERYLGQTVDDLLREDRELFLDSHFVRGPLFDVAFLGNEVVCWDKPDECAQFVPENWGG